MCPYCQSTDISCHLGHCECRGCGQEWSVKLRRTRPIAHVIARIRLQMACAYLRDLQAYRAGDANRFSRMVDGKGYSSASAERWAAFVGGITSDAEVRQWQPGVVRRIERALGAALANGGQ